MTAALSHADAILSLRILVRATSRREKEETMKEMWGAEDDANPVNPSDNVTLESVLAARLSP
jgi:hypothetical protein